MQTKNVQQAIKAIFKRDVKLGHVVSIIIPCDASKIAIEGVNQDYVDAIIAKYTFNFADTFGGVTVLAGNGAWNNHVGQTISEDVKVLSSHTDSLDLFKLSLLRLYAKRINSELNQDCVAITVDGELFLISERAY